MFEILAGLGIIGLALCIVLIPLIATIVLGIYIAVGVKLSVRKAEGFILKLLEFGHVVLSRLKPLAFVGAGVVKDKTAASVYYSEFRQFEFSICIVASDNVRIVAALSSEEYYVVLYIEVTGIIYVCNMCNIVIRFYYLKSCNMHFVKSTLCVIIYEKSTFSIGAGMFRSVVK